MAKRCHLAVNQLLVLASALGVILARSPGSLTASRSKTMTTAAIDCAFPSFQLPHISSFNAASFPSHRRSWGDFFKELSLPPFLLRLLLLSLSLSLSMCACESIWRALCVGADPPWRKEVGSKRERGKDRKERLLIFHPREKREARSKEEVVDDWFPPPLFHLEPKEMFAVHLSLNYILVLLGLLYQ